MSKRARADAIDERDFYDEDIRDQPEAEPDDDEFPDAPESIDDDDASADVFAFARGVVNGVLVALPLWAIVIWAWIR